MLFECFCTVKTVSRYDCLPFKCHTWHVVTQLLFGLSLSFVHPLDTRRLEKLPCRHEIFGERILHVVFSYWTRAGKHEGQMSSPSRVDTFNERVPLEWQLFYTLNVQIYDRKGCQFMIGVVSWYPVISSVRGPNIAHLVVLQWGDAGFFNQTGDMCVLLVGLLLLVHRKPSPKFSDDSLVLKIFIKHGELDVFDGKAK